MQGSRKAPTISECVEDFSTMPVDALRERFPLSERFVGKPVFTRIMNKFIATLQKLPKTPNKTLLKNFIRFVQDYPSVVRYPQLDNMMSFESALYTISQGPDNKPVDYVNMARAITESTDAIIFDLPKGCILLSCNFPVIDIYSAVENNRSLQKQKFQKSKEYFVLLWKEEDNIKCEYLKNPEYKLLTRLKESQPFIKVYSEYLEENNEACIEELLPELCKKGYINGYTISR